MLVFCLYDTFKSFVCLSPLLLIGSHDASHVITLTRVHPQALKGAPALLERGPQVARVGAAVRVGQQLIHLQLENATLRDPPRREQFLLSCLVQIDSLYISRSSNSRAGSTGATGTAGSRKSEGG